MYWANNKNWQISRKSYISIIWLRRSKWMWILLLVETMMLGGGSQLRLWWLCWSFWFHWEGYLPFSRNSYSDGLVSISPNSNIIIVIWLLSNKSVCNLTDDEFVLKSWLLWLLFLALLVSVCNCSSCVVASSESALVSLLLGSCQASIFILIIARWFFIIRSIDLVIIIASIIIIIIHACILLPDTWSKRLLSLAILNSRNIEWQDDHSITEVWVWRKCVCREGVCVKEGVCVVHGVCGGM